MSYITKKIGLYVLLLLIISSCIPEEGAGPIDPTINNPLNISAPSGFTWNTTQEVDVVLSKLLIPISLVRVVTISSETGSVLYKGTHDLSKDLLLKVTIPSYVTKMTVEVGDIVIEELIQNNKITFNFPVSQGEAN